MQHYDSISIYTTACSPPQVYPVLPGAQSLLLSELLPRGLGLRELSAAHRWGSSGRARDARTPGAIRQRNPLWALACCILSLMFGRIRGRRGEAHSKSPGCQATDLDFQRAWSLLCPLPLNTEPWEGQYLGLCSGQRLRNQTPQCRSHSLQLLLQNPPRPAPASVLV